ncbi:hypothetical protein DDE18_00050 [Nocardioides gansuensis]|uniref:Calcium-binding protein n=2 Tax=Nocardioides gansuensis TaxID=2138300 RepID=A0A2T8FEG2_9ACTN|nr:hypothetical protein DDE18_00050 [Nocardioides gansuensis]
MWAPATAVGESCQGRPATIVGTGADIQGTDGDDVIVTGTSTVAYTHAGNDLVCVTPSAADQIWVDTGPGDDVVDASASTARRTAADLGLGVDRYLGSPGLDSVSANGADDTFDAAGGSNGMTLEITGPAGSVTGSYRGSGVDFIGVRSTDRDVTVELDGQVVVDGVPAAEITGFHFAHVQAPGAVLRGNSDDNYLAVRGCSLRIDGAGGDDRIISNPYAGDDTLIFECETKSRLSGGQGDDKIRGRGGHDRLAGNRGNDLLQGGADADLMLGGAGNDELEGGASRDLLRGNGGNDTLKGNPGPDTLLGNRGRDRADGHQGRDRCAAELDRHCER